MMCFECKQVGHRAANCRTLKCRECSAFGHMRHACPNTLKNPDMLAISWTHSFEPSIKFTAAYPRSADCDAEPFQLWSDFPETTVRNTTARIATNNALVIRGRADKIGILLNGVYNDNETLLRFYDGRVKIGRRYEIQGMRTTIDMSETATGKASQDVPKGGVYVIVRAPELFDETVELVFCGQRYVLKWQPASGRDAGYLAVTMMSAEQNNCFVYDQDRSFNRGGPGIIPVVRESVDYNVFGLRRPIKPRDNVLSGNNDGDLRELLSGANQKREPTEPMLRSAVVKPESEDDSSPEEMKNIQSDNWKRAAPKREMHDDSDIEMVPSDNESASDAGVHLAEEVLRLAFRGMRDRDGLEIQLDSDDGGASDDTVVFEPIARKPISKRRKM